MTPTPHELAREQDASADAELGERVVISGMSGLYPSARNVADFADILYNKINPVNAEDCRWSYNHPELSQCTGKVPDLLYFDAQFFKVHYRLGNSMDSMSRKILEQAYQAIYDAGVSPEHLYGKKVGVYVGTCFSETEKAFFYVATSRTGFGVAGCSKTMFANRISYWLNAKGPSMSIDEACCSSTAALERAYQDIQRGECEAAIVGGSNLCLHPQSSIHYGRIMKLSMDEKTKSFDENADGCTKSEAINVLFLQKAKNALRIYAEVVYIKSEFTSLLESEAGPRYGFYRNPDDTVRFLKTFYKEAKVSPLAVEYVEACGSAVKEADKAELEALEKIFCDDRRDPLLVGSVMSNVGYGEAASGITAITKVLLGYHKGILAGNLHCESPRRDIAAIREGRMLVLQDHAPFHRSYAAVNGLSVTGINAHVLLKGHNKQKDLSRYKCAFPHLVLVSGRMDSAVNKILENLESRTVDPEELALLNNIHLTLISGNLGRGFTILGKNDEGHTISLNKEVVHFDYVQRPLWFVYSGMGSQWAGMGTMLMRVPVFAAAISRCHRVLQPKGLDIVHIITTPDKKIFDNILHSFVGIAAIQIGLTDILRELGLVPDKIIGHSVGELGCAYADGCLTAEEMILSAYSRGLVSLQTPFIRGSMAAVGVGYQEILPLCPPAIEVACHNGPDSCTISGPADAMREFVAELVSKDIFAKEVPCSNIAYHSRYIADAGPGLLKYLTEVIKSPKARSERWVSTSVPMGKWEEESAKYSSAEYHTNNLLSPVLFEESSRLIPADAVLVEVAPHGLLQAILKRSLPDSCRNIPLTRRGHPDNAVFLLEAIGKLYLEGFNPSVQNIYPKIEFPVSTGTPMLSHLVEWAHSEKWTVPLYMSARRKTAAASKHLISIHDDEHAYLQGHVIQGKILYPYTASLIAVWDTLAMTLGVPRRQLPVQFRNVTLHVQPVLHDRRQLRLSVALQRATGKFEIMDDINSKLASGFITMEDVKEIQSDESSGNETFDITAKDIYNNFSLNDICYKGNFQSILSANNTLTEGFIRWHDNWVTFIDGMIQLNALRNSYDSYYEPKYIRKLSIVPDIQNQPIMKATISEIYNSTRCGGVLMENIRFHTRKNSSEDQFILTPLKCGTHSGSQQIDGTSEGKYAEINKIPQITLVGQMASLKWVSLPQRGPGVMVKVHYAALNYVDVKRATGSILIDETGPRRYGMDFSGVTESGTRVMGLVESGAVSSHVLANPELLWPVPAHWSLEDAATVPLAYCLAYYCLSIKTQLYPGKSILVHGGAGALGQAVISLALACGCDVFTTVGDLRKKQFLLKLFPDLKAENIGNSRDASFCDMVLNTTKSKGVFIVIGSHKGDLRTVSLKCVGFMGAYIDVNLVPENEKYIFGWNNLQNERGYITVALESIFHENGNGTMKRLQRMIGEGIARGWVRPLSRVTYSPLAVPRAFRLLAAGNQRGRVLLLLHAAQGALTAQPGLQCSPDQWHVVMSDHECLGPQLADMLIRRGVRKLLLYLPISSKDFKLRARQWKSVGVQLCLKEVSDIKKDLKLFNIKQCLEGIYITITETSKPESESNSFIKEVDVMSRSLFPNLKYFIVLNAVNNAGAETCISRVNDHFAATMLTLQELKDREGESGSAGARLEGRATVEAAERALANGAQKVQGRVAPATAPPLLHRLTAIAEIDFPQSIDETTTLSDIGINPAKYADISIFLRNTFHIYLTEKEIKSLSIQRIKEIDEILTKTDFDHDKGLKKLFSYVDTDELQAITEMVFLSTLTTSATMRDDEFDVSQTYLVIVPGVEGHHARFRTLCERLKLPALVLQPGLDRPHETVPELAARFTEVLVKKSVLKKNYYLLGYESGIMVALEMAALLEDKGITGTIFCIGTPDEVKTEIMEHLKGYETNEALQNAVIRHMFVMMTNSSVDDLESALQEASSWQEKLNVTVRALLGRVSHSAQYARQLIEAAYGRTAELLRYEGAVRALRSQLVLLRPTAPRPPRASLAALQPHSRQPVKLHELRAPLAHAAEDLRCAAIINSYLNDDILEEFNNRNLCETYLLNADAFMTDANA